MTDCAGRGDMRENGSESNFLNQALVPHGKLDSDPIFPC